MVDVAQGGIGFHKKDRRSEVGELASKKFTEKNKPPTKEGADESDESIY